MDNYISGLNNIFSPTALKFEAKSIVFGEQFASVLVINDFPAKVGSAWLASITKLPNVSISIHNKPSSADNLVAKLQNSLNDITTEYKKGKTQLSKYHFEQQITNNKAILNKIMYEKQKVFKITVLIRVVATTKYQLEVQVKNVQTCLASLGMRGRVLVYRQENALKATSPYALLPSDIAKDYGFSMLSQTIAASLPFTSSGINDGNGVILGRDNNGGISLIDMWHQADDRSNSNWLVLGKSGVGKTTAVKKILLNNYAQGCKVIVIDPEREYQKLCQKLNGCYLNIGSGAIINPLQVKNVPSENETANNFSLASHFNTLRTFFSIYFKGLTSIQEAFLEQCLEQLYQNFNITYNTDCSKLANDKWPKLIDVYNMVAQNATKEHEQLVTLLRKLALGADAKLYNGYTNIAVTDNDFVVIDTFSLQQSSIVNRRALLYNILTWLWNEIIRTDNRVILAIDEAYLLADKDNPQALQFLRDTAKRIRKYNGSLITISQNINDFLDPHIVQYGQAVVDNPSYKLIMAQGENDLNTLTKLMNFKEAEIDILSNGTRGEALIVVGSKRILTKLEFTDLELELLF